MKIASVFITEGVSAEMVFKRAFLDTSPVTQMDLIQDMIGDLTELCSHMSLNIGVLDALDETGEPHFVLQKILYKESTL